MRKVNVEIFNYLVFVVGRVNFTADLNNKRRQPTADRYVQYDNEYT